MCGLHNRPQYRHGRRTLLFRPLQPPLPTK
jgi:hypothetical protein